jgi:regulatory protein
MLKITEITKQKKGQRYNIFVNGEFTVGVSQDTLAEFNLYRDKEFTNELLKQVVDFDFHQSILQKALRLISASMKTEKMLRIKLYQTIKERKADYASDFDENNILEEIIEKLISMGYLNDLRYATEFVNARLDGRQRSKEVLRVELLSRGISKEIANQVLDKIKVDDNANAELLLIKRFKTKLIKKNETNKINYLRGKGYNWDVISKFISNDFEE